MEVVPPTATGGGTMPWSWGPTCQWFKNQLINFLLYKLFSTFVSIKNKIKFYKTLIRPVLAYGSEAWVLSKSDETILGVFERKILRANFGPTNENGE
jgi:hypothetical protein